MAHSDIKHYITTELEQAETSLSNLAVLLAGYYKSLIENGIPAEHAALLTIAMQSQISNNNKEE